jgi:hypothetical protein
MNIQTNTAIVYVDKNQTPAEAGVIRDVFEAEVTAVFPSGLYSISRSYIFADELGEIVTTSRWLIGRAVWSLISL